MSMSTTTPTIVSIIFVIALTAGSLIAETTDAQPATRQTPDSQASDAQTLKHDVYLLSTNYIDSDHPAVIAAMKQAVGDKKSVRERAISIHDFVRDEIQFGWSASFYDQKASEVLDAKVGFCNTKATLFIAMLRAAEIPARQRFVSINTDIIGDFISPGTPYVDHSYTEVFLNDRWVKTDSYIVDSDLYNAALPKLSEEGRIIGYGVHKNGTHTWDGKDNAFAQFLDDGTHPGLTNIDHGVYSDIGAFYASGNAINQLGIVGRLFFALAKASANNKIESLRQ